MTGRRVAISFNGVVHHVNVDVANGQIGDLREAVSTHARIDLDPERYRVCWLGQMFGDATPLSNFHIGADAAKDAKFEVRPLFHRSSQQLSAGTQRVRSTIASQPRIRARSVLEGAFCKYHEDAAALVKQQGSDVVIPGASSMMKKEAPPASSAATADKKEASSKLTASLLKGSTAVLKDATFGVLGPRPATGMVHIPLVMGSWAKWRGEKAPERKTHEWNVYVRGDINQDLTDIVDKIVFKLHHSFEAAKQTQTITAPPFEITEFGWGEFEVTAFIYLRGMTQPAEMRHFLCFSPKPQQLHCIPPFGAPLQAPGLVPFTLQPNPVVTETHDEVLVKNPGDLLCVGLKAYITRRSDGLRGVTKWRDIQRLVESNEALETSDREMLQEILTKMAAAETALREEYEAALVAKHRQMIAEGRLPSS